MDDVVNDLLQELRALRTDLGSMRAEGIAQHQETIAKIGGLSDRLSLIDVRTAGLESKSHGRYRAAGALMVGTVAALARAALLGK